MVKVCVCFEKGIEECLGGVDLMGVVVWVHFEVWEGSRWLWLFDLSGYVC